VNFDDFHTESKIPHRFLLIGGFLGAGKTTLIGLITKDLENKGLKTALITNDQGQGLMDTASAQQASQGLSNVAEITGGCFCCRLEELFQTIKDLESSGRPDVMIAEPVGSCTDLMATVLQPLEKVYQTPMILAPLSVVLDARRALVALGGKKNKRSFHRDVGYVFRKQLEEGRFGGPPLTADKGIFQKETILSLSQDRRRVAGMDHRPPFFIKDLRVVPKV